VFGVIKKAFRMMKWKELRMEYGNCSMCGKTLFIKLRNDAISTIRCVRCRANVTSMALASVFKNLVPNWEDKEICELSSRGPFFRFLHKRASHLTYSEYFDDVTPGAYKGAVQCQDVQELTYANHSFDVCTCTEVFEHVPDDLKGFSEIYRILKPRGLFLFTVPLSGHKETVERARLSKGEVIILESPQYHDDHIRGLGAVLCYRNYGLDIVEKLTQAGFKNSEIISVKAPTRWGYDRRVVVARK
jgi:SAM-dependent methyltransferase